VLANDFDICLIDFPGHDQGPLVCCGLRAADRWLFPVVPDRMSTREVDGSKLVLRRAFSQDHPRPLKGLGTVITLCQQRNGNEYKKAKALLRAGAEKRAIPKLFPEAAEITYSTDAKNALDEFLHATTIDKMFGGAAGPLYQSIRALAREIVERLHLPLAKADEIKAEEEVNALATAAWV